jgi:hypothetical protein
MLRIACAGFPTAAASSSFRPPRDDEFETGWPTEEDEPAPLRIELAD